jgi:hypothetical protein
MDAEDKKKLDRVLELAEENNRYIRKVRSTQKTSQMMTAIYWVVIIVVALGGLYYIQPYFKSFSSLYSSFSGGNGGLQLTGSNSEQIQSLINQFKSQPTTK